MRAIAIHARPATRRPSGRPFAPSEAPVCVRQEPVIHARRATSCSASSPTVSPMSTVPSHQLEADHRAQRRHPDRRDAQGHRFGCGGGLRHARDVESKAFGGLDDPAGRDPGTVGITSTSKPSTWNRMPVAFAPKNGRSCSRQASSEGTRIATSTSLVCAPGGQSGERVEVVVPGQCPDQGEVGQGLPQGEHEPLRESGDRLAHLRNAHWWRRARS